MLGQVSQSFLHSLWHLRRVVCQVQEQGDTLHTAVLLEVLCEEATRFQVHTHGTENDGEVVIVVIVHTLGGLSDQTSLSTNLGSDFVMRKTGRREDGNLLTAGNRVHRVNGRNTGRDHFFGVHLVPSAPEATNTSFCPYTRVRVDGAAVDVKVVFRKHLGTLVDSLS
jgi:hypothetical protein